MKKPIYLTTIIIIITIAVFNMQFSGGPPAGHTGSPADNKTCGSNGGCHTGNPVIAQTGWITADIPMAGYMPGAVYTIKATVTQTGTKFGFQLSPQDSSGNLLGTLATGTGTKLVGNGKYIEHTSAGNTGTDSLSWVFNWTAPAAGTGEVTFYAAFNAANNNGNSTGDQIYTSTLTVPEDTMIMGIPGNSIAVPAQIYPNPSNGIFEIEMNDMEAEAMIFDASGKLIQKYHGTNNGIDLTSQGPGLYFIKTKSKNQEIIQKVIVK